MTTIGLIGAGNIGQAVARLAVDHGYDVVLSNSRGPETLADVVAGARRRARRPTPPRAPRRRGDLVVVTIPFKAYQRRPRRAAGRQGRHRHQQLLPAARRPDRRARRRVHDVGLAAPGAPAGLAGRQGVQPHPVRAPHRARPARRDDGPPGARDRRRRRRRQGHGHRAHRRARLRRRRRRPARGQLADRARHPRLRPAAGRRRDARGAGRRAALTALGSGGCSATAT